MSRVKRGTQVKKKHKKLLKMVKGYRGGQSRLIKHAHQAVMKAGLHAYRSRKIKKRDFRTLWNARISAAVKPHGLNYSRFIEKLFKSKIALNRKMLSELAFQFPEAFGNLVDKVKKNV